MFMLRLENPGSVPSNPRIIKPSDLRPITVSPRVRNFEGSILVLPLNQLDSHRFFRPYSVLSK